MINVEQYMPTKRKTCYTDEEMPWDIIESYFDGQQRLICLIL